MAEDAPRLRIEPLWRCSEREIAPNAWQAIVHDHRGEMVFACEHAHPAWEWAADCAYLWTIKQAIELGLMPRGRR